MIVVIRRLHSLTLINIPTLANIGLERGPRQGLTAEEILVAKRHRPLAKTARRGGTRKRDLVCTDGADPRAYGFTRKIISVPLSRCTLSPRELTTEAVAKGVVCENRLRPGSPTTPWLLADKELFAAVSG